MRQERKEENKNNMIDFWKQFFCNNLAIKLLSLVFAVFVWLLITNVADPYKTKSFSVDVQMKNEDAISSAHKVFEIIEGKVATVKVTGKRSIIDKLTPDDVIAVADLSELSSVNAVAIRAQIRKYNSGDLQIECNTVMKISLEDMETKQIKVSVNCDGSPMKDFSVGNCVAKPNVIEVTGGMSVIDRIASVAVNVNVNGASDSFTSNVEPKAYDEKGNQIKSSTLKFSAKKVKVRVKILEKKTIPVIIDVKGKPAEGYTFVEISSSPEEIEIAGNSKKFQSIKSLVIPINIEGFDDTSEGLEQDIKVEDYLDSSISVPEEEDQQISIKITIESLAKKHIRLSPDQIVFKDLGEEYSAKILSVTQIPIVVKGRASILDNLTEVDLMPYVNCKGLGTGVYTLSIRLSSANGYVIAEPVKIKLQITKSNTDLTTDSAQNTEAPEASEKPTEEPAE